MLCVLMDSLSVRQARRVVNCPQDNMDAVLCQRLVLNDFNMLLFESLFLPSISAFFKHFKTPEMSKI